MSPPKRLLWRLSPLLIVLSIEAAHAQSFEPQPHNESLQSRELRYQSDLIRSLLESRKRLEELRELYQSDLRKQQERLQALEGLYEKRVVSRLELEQTEHAVAAGELRIAEVERQIAAEEIATAEAVAREELLREGPETIGRTIESAVLVRFDGAAEWSLANVARLEAFFMGKFGRPLPISALGQTAVHDRLRFDHSEAVDIALHPDSAEGRALIAYLRSEGIPFLAFRGKLPGAATGAHIHIGKPSVRGGLLD